MNKSHELTLVLVRLFFRWEIGVAQQPSDASSEKAHRSAPNELASVQNSLATAAPQIQVMNHLVASPIHYRTIISNSRIHILENASLVIRDVGKQDQGFYLCQAANNFGSQSALIKLTVNGKLLARLSRENTESKQTSRLI